MTQITARAALAAAACALAGTSLAMAAAPAQAAAQRFDLTLTVRLTGGGGADMRQKGTFSGRPFGKGTCTLRTRLGAGSGAVFTLDMGNRHGRVHGTGDVALAFRGGRVTYRGTARITSGNGAYRGVRAKRLKVLGQGTITSDRFSVRIWR